MSTDENGLIVVTLDDPNDMIDGAVVVTLDWLDDMIDGVIVITLTDETEEEDATYYEALSLDCKIYGTAFHSWYEMYLPPGDYRITPVGGATNDWLGYNAWAWHLRTSAGDLGGTYSMLAPTWGQTTDTPEAALASVLGDVLIFSWPGGTFKMTIPCDERVPDNNYGSLDITIESF